jgi:acyl-coenzyme A synthetase/AMP-(fatty) acid ligase
VNLVDPILWHGRTQPNTVAIIDGDRTLTYGELAELVQRTAGHLCALGVRRGDYVGLCLKDDWQHVVALLAVARVGATFVQIDPRARPVERARIAGAFDFKLVLTLPDADAHANCATIALDSTWYRHVAQAESPNSMPQEWNDAMLVQSTSGTTGLPKFTVATHLQFYFRLANYGELLPLNRPLRYLATLPLFFGYGRIVCLLHLLHGATLIFYPSMFSADEFVEAVRIHHANVAAVVPSSIRQLLAAAGNEMLLPDLQLLLSAGAPLFADEKCQAVRKLTSKFHEVYAVSAVGQISVLRPQDVPRWADSVGRPFPLAEIEIVDEDDLPVRLGESGQLRCRGPGLASPIHDYSTEDFRNGWHYPGEVAAFDEFGYLHLHGRTSEVFYRGGAKVFPTEIEAVLQTHDKVADAAVVARVAPGGEQELAAYVIAKEQVTPGQLLAHCRQRLTPYKVPQQIHIVSELPRNTSGKVDKRALANQAVSTRASI